MLSFFKSAALLATRFLRVGVALYLLVILMLLLLENWLIYPAPRYPDGDWQAERPPHEDVFFSAADGVKLHGWYCEHPAPKAVLLYCHGNGDSVGHLGPYLEQLIARHQVSIFAFDYRGYGRSEGRPGETGILLDGEAAQAWLAQRAGKSPAELVLMGRSLGGGVAVHLAAKNGCQGLILQSTFTSVPEVAAFHYPWAPVRWLMKNRYNSLKKIKEYDGPLLQSHGSADEVVPISLGRQLHEAAIGRKEFFEVPGGDHNSAEPEEYEELFAKFLDSLSDRD